MTATTHAPTAIDTAVAQRRDLILDAAGIPAAVGSTDIGGYDSRIARALGITHRNTIHNDLADIGRRSGNVWIGRHDPDRPGWFRITKLPSTNEPTIIWMSMRRIVTVTEDRNGTGVAELDNGLVVACIPKLVTRPAPPAV